MKKANLPRHVAIIPDGNRRWAKSKHLPTFAGHRRGFDALIKIARKSRELGIKIVTVWAFSTENWKRTKGEISYLMNLFEELVDKYLQEALQEKVRIIHLGRKDRIGEALRKKITEAENKTGKFTRHYLCIALDYGGRDEIIRTINKIRAEKIKITETNFNDNLDTKNLPFSSPDLIIRTGGEKRLSGFLLWQNQYSEIIFVDKYFPDFTPVDFVRCLKEYSQRQRRFGK